jgi:ABC-type branched-subunit amino acid transport system ATPase component
VTEREARGFLLETRDVEVELDGTQILRGASLSVREGEVHVLIGPNGAGKTTFANAITGHVPLRAGSITLARRSLSGAVYRRVRAGIGRKFQVPRVFLRLTSGENLEIALAGPASAVSSGVTGIDIGDPAQPAVALSHGGRQRLEMRMVLGRGPALAVLDEPTAGMTREERTELAERVRAEAGRHTFLIVEHDMDFVEKVADTVSFMDDGRVLASGSFAAISADAQVRAAYLGTVDEEAPSTVGTRSRPASDGVAGDELSIENISVFRGPLAAVRNVSFHVPAGGALGVLGRNGAGKTTLLMGIVGLLPTTGAVRVNGTSVEHDRAWRRARRGLALVPQGRQLMGNLSVAENLRLAETAPRGGGPAFDVNELFPALSRLALRKAGLLSGGEQQQVAIARALLRRPTTMFLDEPTEGLAPVIVQEITAVLQHLVASGLTLVVAEQHQWMVERLCDSFLLLRSGEAAASGPISPGAIAGYYSSL